MGKRNVLLALVLFFSIAVFAVQTLSQTRRSNQPVKQPDRKDIRKRIEDRRRESAKEVAEANSPSKFDHEQWQKDDSERFRKIKKEFLYEKYALRVTEEQWKVIKPKLEKVRYLAGQADIWAKTAAFGTSTSNEVRSGDRRTQNKPTVQWMKGWEGKAPGELTEGERIAEQLIKLVENKDSDAEQVRLKMDALRRYKQQAGKQLPKTIQDLRDGLTPRQEAALMLMRYF